MKKVFICNIICVSLIIIMSLFLFSGCVAGIVSEDQYQKIFDGVDATDYDDNTVYYQIKTLIDEETFNKNLQSKAYCKLDIYLKQSCQIRGVVLLIRSSDNATLKFTTHLNGEKQAEITKEFSKDVNSDIDMFFVDIVDANARSDFYIEIEELNKGKDEEKTKFKFDSLIIFLAEEI